MSGVQSCRHRTVGAYCAHKAVKVSTLCADLLADFACPACACGEPCQSLGGPLCLVCHDEMRVVRAGEKGTVRQ